MHHIGSFSIAVGLRFLLPECVFIRNGAALERILQRSHESKTTKLDGELVKDELMIWNVKYFNERFAFSSRVRYGKPESDLGL